MIAYNLGHLASGTFCSGYGVCDVLLAEKLGNVNHGQVQTDEWHADDKALR